MSKIEEAREILSAIGLPYAQHNEMSALTLLALCGLGEDDPWKNAVRKSLGVSKGIMAFMTKQYKINYAPNTRETVRRHVLHQFVQARVVDLNPDNLYLAKNSSLTHYALTKEILPVIHAYGTADWNSEVMIFIKSIGTLTDLYLKERKATYIPVVLSNGMELILSAGRHNEVQAAIIEEFAPRFTNGGILLYLGDTAKKDLFMESDKLLELGIPIDKHSKLPDVVIYDPSKNWLFLIEAVTSHGPVSPKRIVELEELLINCTAGKVYVTAFPDFAEFKKHSANIAWETEVWLMEVPDHMIHFNGDRFIGPR